MVGSRNDGRITDEEIITFCPSKDAENSEETDEGHHELLAVMNHCRSSIPIK